MRDFTHLRSGTVLMALLQPAPEVYDLFDDVLLMSEGAPVSAQHCSRRPGLHEHSPNYW